MQGHEYWEQIVKSSDVTGPWNKDNTIKSYDDGSKKTAESFVSVMVQLDRCIEIYENPELDDSFLKPEMEKLKQELEGL